MKIISRLIVLFVLVACAHVDAAPRRGGVPNGSSPPPVSVFPETYYKTFSAGWPGSPSKFPVSIFFTTPNNTGSAYYSCGGCGNVAAAAAVAGINIFAGIPNWPENSSSDNGELAAIKAASPTVYTFGGGNISFTTNTGPLTVSAAQATAAGISAQANLIGYFTGDEPNCTGSGSGPTAPQMAGAVAAVSKPSGYDNTRGVYNNSLGWTAWYVSNPAVAQCGGTQTDFISALTSPFMASFDDYPQISGYDRNLNYCNAATNIIPSDFATVSADCNWVNGLGVANALLINGGAKPVWGFSAGGGDALGYSGGANFLATTITSGSTTVTNAQGGNPPITFTAALENGLTITSPQGGTTSGSISGTTLTIAGTWNGVNFAVGQFIDSTSGVSAGTRITALGTGTGGLGTYTINNSQTVGSRAISSDWFQAGTTLTYLSASTLTLSHATQANQSGIFTYFTGGDVGSCKVSINLCAPYANEYRQTSAEVNAEVWWELINGALAIQWFPYDSSCVTFVLGCSAGSTAATAALANITYIDATAQTYAAVLQQPWTAKVSMLKTDQTTLTTKTDGILTMATGTSSVPGGALLQSYGGDLYLFTEQGRLGSATMTYSITGYAGHTATLIYDSDAQYNAPGHVGDTFVLNGSAQFSDTLNSTATHAYQVKVYKIP